MIGSAMECSPAVFRCPWALGGRGFKRRTALNRHSSCWRGLGKGAVRRAASPAAESVIEGRDIKEGVPPTNKPGAEKRQDACRRSSSLGSPSLEPHRQTDALEPAEEEEEEGPEVARAGVQGPVHTGANNGRGKRDPSAPGRGVSDASLGGTRPNLREGTDDVDKSSRPGTLFEEDRTERPRSVGGREDSTESVRRVGGREESTESVRSVGGVEDGTERLRSVGGVEVSAETAAIALVYFVQGVLGLSRLAVTFFLKDDFNLDPAEVAVLTGLAAGPWLIKPLYGFISDGIPLFGYRRRSYLIGSGLLGALAWLLMATVVNDKYSAVLMIVSSSFAAAVSDVVVDSIVVARARGEPQSVSGSLQSLCWGSSAFGSVLSAYFSGSLVEHWGPRAVFGLTALLPLITTGVGFFVPEQAAASAPHLTPDRSAPGAAYQQRPQSTGGEKRNVSSEQSAVSSISLQPQQEQLQRSSTDNRKVVSEPLTLGQSLRQQLGQLWTTFQMPEILLPTLFIFFWQATPHSETAMFFYTTNQLGFGPEFLGRVRLVTALASLGGVALYNSVLRSVPLRSIFFWSNIGGTVLGSTQLLLVTGLNRALGISDQFFLLGDSLILAALGQASFMPVLVLAARVCPPGIEATLFASLMSISNGAGVVGGLLGAALTSTLHVTSTDFTNLAWLLAICNFSSLLALPLLRLLPNNTDSKED